MIEEELPRHASLHAVSSFLAHLTQPGRVISFSTDCQIKALYSSLGTFIGHSNSYSMHVLPRKMNVVREQQEGAAKR